jgi:catechol 2,3-dioxygenase
MLVITTSRITKKEGGIMQKDSPIHQNPGSDTAGIAPSGHRLPATTRLGRVRLQVADLARSLDWYEHVLGLRVLESGNGQARLAAQGSAEPLVELHERPGAAPVPQRGRLGLYHFALLLPDRPALGAFLRHLAALGERAGASDHLVSEALYLQDPDGLGIEVYADRPRSDWAVEAHEIRMATVSLDAQSLAVAARNTAWTGMPAGTQMGHLHLHIGALDEANNFYHQGLGFDRVVWSYPGALFLSAGGYHHHLGLNTWAAGGAKPGDGDARLLDWELVLPSQEDVPAAAKGLSDAGYNVRTDAGEAWATDPWGTTLRITHRPVQGG